MKHTYCRIVAALLAVALAWLPSTAVAQASTVGEHAHPQLEDFAYAITLKPTGSRAIHTLVVPESVYGGCVESDLSDLRVFNDDGVAVPHAIRSLGPSSHRVNQEHQVRFFPLYAEERPSDETSGTELSVETRQDGSILRVNMQRTEARSSSAKERAIVGYLLDTSSLKSPITAFVLRFEDASGQRRSDYLAQVALEKSNDLTHFIPVSEPQSLLRFTYGGESIERSRLGLPAIESRYFRLTWTGKLPAALVSLTAETGVVEARETPVSAIFTGQPSPDGDAFLYDLKGNRPVDRLRILLDEENLLFKGQVEVAPHATGPYRGLDEGTYYRLRHQGTLFESPGRRVARSHGAYLRLKWLPVSSPPGKAPRIEVTHDADQLLFAARGAGPFELAFGHHGAPRSALSANELLSPLPIQAQEALPLSDCQQGPLRVVAGSAAKQAPLPPPPWKRYALWFVLLIAVGALAYAAFLVLRDTKAES